MLCRVIPSFVTKGNSSLPLFPCLVRAYSYLSLIELTTELIIGVLLPNAAYMHKMVIVMYMFICTLLYALSKQSHVELAVILEDFGCDSSLMNFKKGGTHKPCC
jgi:hypothetical protein